MITAHRIEFEYKLPEWGAIDMDVDDSLDKAEIEAAAIAEIKDVYEDITDIEVTKVIKL